jgi:hypothetical protein
MVRVYVMDLFKARMDLFEAGRRGKGNVTLPTLCSRCSDRAPLPAVMADRRAVSQFAIFRA